MFLFILSRSAINFCFLVDLIGGSNFLVAFCFLLIFSKNSAVSFDIF
jgi:hypothetical protein